VVGGDIGGAVAVDLTLRYPGLVDRLCFFNGPEPYLPDQFAAAGIARSVPISANPVLDYFVRQGTDPDGLLAELDTPERRRRYIAEFYGHRLWAPAGSFTAEDVDFMTEPFADAERMRACWVDYEVACDRRRPSVPERSSEPVHIPTLVLYGPEDPVVPSTFPERCAIAFTHCIGPFVVRGAGHFLQWERADVLNRALTWFLADLRLGH
jgi:pimeloyl-ACP methyl ester carboxylesterase